MIYSTRIIILAAFYAALFLVSSARADDDHAKTIEVWSCWIGDSWVVSLDAYHHEELDIYDGKVTLARSGKTLDAVFTYYGLSSLRWSWGGKEMSDFTIVIAPNGRHGRGEYIDLSILRHGKGVEATQTLSCKNYPDLED